MAGILELSDQECLRTMINKLRALTEKGGQHEKLKRKLNNKIKVNENYILNIAEKMDKSSHVYFHKHLKNNW